MSKIDIVNIAKNRYTTKHYDQQKQVAPEALQELLAVLKYSPSSVNSQPWHFIVVNNQTAQDKILPGVAEFNHDRIIHSSYTIIFCVKTQLDDHYLQHILDKEDEDGRFLEKKFKDGEDQGRRYFFGLNNTSKEKLWDWENRQLYLSLGQFLFAAKAIGIDSTAMEGFDPQKIDELFHLKEKGLKSVVLASIGYHSENDNNAKRPKSRLTDEELFTFVS